MTRLDAAPVAASDLLQDGLGLLGRVLDGVATAACFIDAEERIQSWNACYERFFPEHRGLLRRGWPYAENLRRYFEANSSASDPAHFEEILAAGIARHRAMVHPTLFQKKDGRRLRSQIVWFADRSCLKTWTDETFAHSHQDPIASDAPQAASGYGIAIFDAAGRFVRANRQLEELFPRAVDLFDQGASYADHLRRYAETAFAESEREKIQALVGRGDPPPQPLDRPLVIRRRDGGWLQLEERRLFDGRMNALWLDISAVKSLEATNAELNRLVGELTEARLKAESANRVRSEFVAMMSHELRTPLHAIIGFAEVIRDLAGRKPGLDAFIGHAGDILEGGRRLLGAIDEMLDLARIDSGRFQLDARAIDPEKLLHTCMRLTADEATRRGIGVSTSIAAGCPTIWADEAALRKVLLNLISNGLKFTPVGGRVRLGAEGREEGRVRLSIADTGVGIPADRLSGIFEPFTRLDASYRRETEGVGVGLALVRELVSHMGGEIQIRSEVGRGTVVELNLPSQRPAGPRGPQGATQ
jgi:signal transduction histidine kinase